MQTDQFLSEGQQMSIWNFQHPQKHTLAQAAAVENEKRINIGPVEVVEVRLHSASDQSFSKHPQEGTIYCLYLNHIFVLDLFPTTLIP